MLLHPEMTLPATLLPSSIIFGLPRHPPPQQSWNCDIDFSAWPGVKHGTMSPLPTFAPDWFGAKLPLGTPPLRPLPDPAAFHPSQLRLGELIAQIPEVATVAPAVAAMVAQAIRAAPLLTPTMAPPAMPTFSNPTFVAPAVALPKWTVAPSYGGHACGKTPS